MGNNKKIKRNNDGVVYSTDPAFIYKEPEQSSGPKSGASKQVLHLLMERKGRGGKTVTIIRDFKGNQIEIKILEKELKNHCGAGGSTVDGDIIIQGEHRDKIRTFLEQKGHRVKG